MQEKLLKDLVSMVAGQGSEHIIDVLYKKKNVNEFLIAKKLDITINQARNILYKLADEGLVVFSRKKDKKSGGWYTYFWTLNVHKSLIILKERVFNESEKLKEILNSKISKQHYACKHCGMEVNEETALEHNFTCLECGEVFELKDNTGSIEDIKNKLIDLSELSSSIEVEIVKIRAKEEAAKARREKLEAKEKAEKRKAKRKAAKKAKKKVVKKAGKKVKKKVVKKAKKKVVKKSGKSKTSRKKK